MQLHRIPILYCPFIGAIHPNVNEIEEHTLQWLLDFRLVTKNDTYLRYKKNKFPLFIARTFPNGDFIDICTWCDLNSLLFIVDDLFDANDTIKEMNSFEIFQGKIMSILKCRSHLEIDDGPIFAAFSDIWERLCLRSSGAWQKKFINCIKKMFDGLFWQFKNIQLGIFPTYDDYLSIRQYLGASHLSTDSLEITGKIYLPEEVYQNKIVNKLTELSRNCVCFANDLFSLGKETIESQNSGEYNLVGVIKRKHKLSWEDAIKKTADFHDGLVREFIFLTSRSYVFDKNTNEMLAKYIRALEIQMVANIEWSTKETDRYPHIYGDILNEIRLYN
jgi:hypothetical protein